MPKKPKFIHPLHAVRKVMGKTQSELAALLGCSASSIQSIELGRLRIRDDTARKLALLTGISEGCLKMKRAKATSVLRKPFSAESYLEWQSILQRTNDESLEVLCKKVLPLLVLLFRAAGEKQKAYPVGELLRDWMKDIQKKFNLGASMNLALAGVPGARDLTPGELELPLIGRNEMLLHELEKKTLNGNKIDDASRRILRRTLAARFSFEPPMRKTITANLHLLDMLWKEIDRVSEDLFAFADPDNVPDRFKQMCDVAGNPVPSKTQPAKKIKQP